MSNESKRKTITSTPLPFNSEKKKEKNQEEIKSSCTLSLNPRRTMNRIIPLALLNSKK
jgi:hypothetical protein